MKYLVIYHFFETWFLENRVFHGTRVYETRVSWKILKYFDVTRVHRTRVPWTPNHKKNSNFFRSTQVSWKTQFSQIEFQKSGSFLNISQIIVDLYIFSQIVVYGHFDLSLPEVTMFINFFHINKFSLAKILFLPLEFA